MIDKLFMMKTSDTSNKISDRDSLCSVKAKKSDRSTDLRRIVPGADSAPGKQHGSQGGERCSHPGKSGPQEGDRRADGGAGSQGGHACRHGYGPGRFLVLGSGSFITSFTISQLVSFPVDKVRIFVKRIRFLI